MTPEEHARFVSSLPDEWGKREAVARLTARGAPSLADDEALIDWFTEQQRRAATPEEAAEMANWFWQTDATAVLDAIHVPTVVLMRAENEHVAEWRYLAGRIHGAIRRAARA